jgi:hypothetical protein
MFSRRKEFWMTELDSALISTYVEFDTPADQLALHAELAEPFVEAVRLKTQTPIVREHALARLLALRKMGRLPRLRRRRRGR